MWFRLGDEYFVFVLGALFRGEGHQKVGGWFVCACGECGEENGSVLLIALRGGLEAQG